MAMAYTLVNATASIIYCMTERSFDLEADELVCGVLVGIFLRKPGESEQRNALETFILVFSFGDELAT